ncbi:phosphohydrolase [Actibacterium atlanticum]|uniref:Phosphohydrolase n=1 Tax=Actibacterium atlanticum TaxID=1461693 RepID=A0A058ZLE9_9RHOB|nr:metallophosphoesterase [Actibacterium atlanticum]KCV82449.1 phosphohydrolase [Actibacterium atlanticum]
MTSSNVTNILHLTDLHYKTDRSYDQNIVLGALLADIQLLAKNVGEPDLIVFSGDLVHSADDTNTYDKLYDEFIERLLKVTNCDHSRLFLAPGNHDLHRSAVKTNRDQQEKLVVEFTDRNSLNAAYLGGQLTKFAQDKLSAYFDFSEFFERPHELYSNEFGSAHDIPELGITVVSLNTAWLGWAGLDKLSDAGLLAFPEAVLTEIIAEIQKDRFVVFNYHHPDFWQNDASSSDFKDLLDKTGDLLLFGHVHDPRPATVGHSKQSLVQNQAGALYTWRQDRYLGYSMIRVSPKEKFAHVILRSYFDKRRAFDAASNISDTGGNYYSCDRAETFFNSVIDAGRLATLKAWVANEVKTKATEDYSEGVLEKPTHDVFVPPPLVRLVLKDLDKENDRPIFVEQPIKFAQIIDSEHNFIVESLPEHGKTSLLNQLCIDTAVQAGQKNSHRHLIPVVLHFNDFSPGTKRAEKAVRDCLPGLPNGCTIESLLADGCFTLFIDDLARTDGKRLEELRKFISKYKKNRFVITTTAVKRKAGLVPDFGFSANFEQVVLKQFRRTDLRKLVQKMDDGGVSEEELLDRVIAKLRAINVPATPINSSLLADIISRDKSFSPLNRPTLIERFIETLLEKNSLGEVERKKFDFTNQVHYLGSVAEHMCRENKYVFQYDEIFLFTDSYLKGLGLNFGAKDIIDNTIASKIFLSRKGSDLISFRFRAFLEFFVAAQMRNKKCFRDWVLNDQRYLSYMNEIEYYAGLARNDLELLQFVSSKHIEYHDDLFGADFQNLFKSIDTTKLPLTLEDNEKFAEELAGQLQEAPMSQSERDEVLDAELPRDAEGRQEVFRPQADDIPSKYMISLFIYTALVKNTELIEDTEKRLHLANVLKSWASTILTSFFLIPNLVKNRKMTINGLSYIVSYPHDYTDDQVAKSIAINLPKEVGRLVFLLLGTGKLEVQLSQKTMQETDEPDLVEFLRCCLRIDLRLGEWWKLPRQFSDRVKGNKSLQETMLSKATEVYRLGSDPQPIQNELEDEIVDIYSSVYAVSKGKRAELRNRKKKSMQRSRNLKRLTAKLPGSDND